MRRPSPSISDPSSASARPRRRRPWVLALLTFGVVAGLALDQLGILDWHAGLAVAQRYADSWWLAPMLALVTAALFAASLPGSLMVWVVGILLPPAIAAPLFVASSVVGALAAYSLAGIAGYGGEAKAGDGRLLQLLARRSGFAALLALRIAPGIPHSAINVAAGILGVPRGKFLITTALGFAIKGTLYVVAIHQATLVGTPEGAISWRTLVPLAGMSLVLLFAPPLVRRLRAPSAPAAIHGESA